MRPKSKKAKVLAWLQEGNSITQLEALRMFGSFRLGDIIFKLRKQYGQDYIITTMIDVETRFGKSRVGEYSI